MKNVLITGGSGFIGSNLINYLLETYGDLNILNVDKLTYAADQAYLDGVNNNQLYNFMQADICNAQQIENIIQKYNIDSIIHLAAESHVDNSIEAPLQFSITNILGTNVLLEAFRKFCTGRFHYVSTDEIYGALGSEGMFTEQTPLAPNSPYSASKASGGLLARSYHRTFGLDIVTTSCSNNYGPHQHREKLIPTVIQTALAGKPIPVYGDGKNIRDWLYVRDHCHAIDLVFRNGRSGETYNIGGDCEVNNIDLVTKICTMLDEIQPSPQASYTEQITFVTDRKGHDFRYAVDCTKIKQELNWTPSSNFDTLLNQTIEYYVTSLKPSPS
jgi:dTDP-glucose 4,6-dehydratase